jgi:GR25 family glycosyltransferase involved in LPS biosynthesis
MEPKETENNVVQETTRRKKGAMEAQIYKLKDLLPNRILCFFSHSSITFPLP